MDTNDDAAKRAVPWLERTASWTFLGIFFGLILLAFVASWIMPSLFWSPPPGGLEQGGESCAATGTSYPGDGGIFYDYFWWPILCDKGYNPVNTASWAVLLGLMLLWAYRVTVELKERVDFGLISAVVPYLVWGSIFRVLEDADLFSPYGRGLPDPGTGTSILDQSLGIFFITPIIYVEILFIAVLFLLWGHRARRVADALGPLHGMRYFALTLVLMVALGVAVWAADPTWVRYVANPVADVLAAAVAYAFVHFFTTRTGRFSTRAAMGAYGLYFIVLGLWYVISYMMGGNEVWFPGASDPLGYSYPLGIETAVRGWPIQWWILVAMIVAPLLVVWACRRLGLVLGGATIARTGPQRIRKDSGKHVAILTVILLLQALAVFLTVVGLRDLAQRQIAGAWAASPGSYPTTIGLLAAGPLLVWLGVRLAQGLAAGPTGVHPNLLFYAHPVNLLMVAGQMTDALMTSLGIDLFHYSEKHVLPRFLIDGVEALGLPPPFVHFPTAIVMIPLKLLVVLMVVVAIDMSAAKDLKERENLVGLVKLGIIMVGLSPGVRDGIRLAMAV